MKEIKPKQWVRTEYGAFMSYDTILENYTMYEFLALHQNFMVEDTLLELVKDKDLIRVKYDCDSSEIEEVRKITGEDFICGDGYHIYFSDVIEILTPSSNGYDSQWKKGIK